MAQHATPPDQLQWRESVLSTRSMSFAGPSSLATPRAQTSSHKPTLPTLPSPSTSTSSDYEMTSPALSATFDPSLPSTVSSSPLFRLPSELRRQIFLPLLSSLPLGVSFPAPPAQDRRLHPRLLQLNSILHAELVPLLYGANKLIFSHPSDANVFSRAVADGPAVAAHVSSVVLRVKSADVKLWTNYFNSASAERGLVVDFPNLARLGVRFRGPRYIPQLSPEQNCANWLRDGKLLEVIPAVAKCVEEVYVEICVKVPEGFTTEVWERVAAGTAVDGSAFAAPGEEIKVRRRGEYIRVKGCWMKLETEGT